MPRASLFSGERAYEIYIEANYASYLWQKLAEILPEFDGVCYGLEALGALRIEKGHVTGAELDGRVTLEDAGFAKMASSKKDYVGNVLRHRPYFAEHDARQQLVGIMPVDEAKTFHAGAILCESDHVEGFGEGWISAVTHSPALGHWIGLGFAKGGYDAWQNKELIAADPVRGQSVRVKLVSPHMYDPKEIDSMDEYQSGLESLFARAVEGGVKDSGSPDVILSEKRHVTITQVSFFSSEQAKMTKFLSSLGLANLPSYSQLKSAKSVSVARVEMEKLWLIGTLPKTEIDASFYPFRFIVSSQYYSSIWQSSRRRHGKIMRC